MRNNEVSCEEVKDLAWPEFIIDDIDNDMIDETVEESNKDNDLFDSVCAICDNGGELFCCDGKCMRSFHANEDGEEYSCVSLGFNKKEVDEIQNFCCKNCEYNQHQCFACGTLGCSDNVLGAEVFKCASATCGFFYHPHCVARLLHCEVDDIQMELQRKIARGEPFTCPVHYCCICTEMENKQKQELQFAVCRRCPKSYHRKCLPRKISFENEEDEGIMRRAWEGLLPNSRILIYCLKHEIDDKLGTPVRDHIKFPKVKTTVQEINTEEKTKPATKERVILNENNVELDCEENQPSLNEKLHAYEQKGSEQINSGNQIDNVADNTLSVKPTKILSGASPQLDADSERLVALFKKAMSSITMENVKKDLKFTSTHTHSLKNAVEKTITMGKLEGSVEAVRTAVRILDKGDSIRNAEAVCGPDVLNQIFKWKDKLKEYLAPVVYGDCYTSYGRLFTQVEKLKGIVDKLHWYVQNGDTIVDFCCGANDFSILMKKKLEETGKICSYKNYDLLPAKNDFNFEMRDWMTVQQKELPSGPQLIMGLTPPIGLKAALANKFIDKALEFEPKLLILVVPSETERLDKKRSPYDLVWKDERFLSGKSFYLPGSVDTNDKQMEQWNVRPPPLYLWSRPNWTNKHKLIAQEHGHLFRQHEVSEMESLDNKKSPASHTMDDNYYGDDLMLGHDLLRAPDNENQPSMNEGQIESSSHGNVDPESQERQEYRVSKAEKISWKRKRAEENEGRGPAVTSPARRQARNEMLEGGLDHGISNPLDGRSPVERFQPKSDMIPPDIEVGDNDNRHLEPRSSSRLEFGAAYDGTQKWPIVANSVSDYGIKDIEKHHSHVRMDSLGSEPPIIRRNSTSERSVPQPGYKNRLPGFAAGPNHLYSRQNSAGWLDE